MDPVGQIYLHVDGFARFASGPCTLAGTSQDSYATTHSVKMACFALVSAHRLSLVLNLVIFCIFKIFVTIVPRLAHLSGRVTTVGKQSLARDPAALSNQEADERSNVLDVRQTAAQTLALVVGNRLGGFLRVEEGYCTTLVCVSKDSSLCVPSTHECPWGPAPRR